MISWNRVLLRLSRWPRRIAALVCLGLAAFSAVNPGHAEAPSARRAPRSGNPVAARLARDQVAVPVSVASFAASGLVRVGDHVGVLSGPAGVRPTLVADHLRVLSIDHASSLDSDATVIVVAAGRGVASHLAPPDNAQVVVVLDGSP